MKNITIQPIGTVRATDDGFMLEIDKPYRAALNGLSDFSHVMVFWWAHQNDTPEMREILEVDLPYATAENVGVFACRSERRPNPIAVSTTGIIHVDVEAGSVILPWIDAFDGTPILDLKPFIPSSDRVRDFRVAPWMAEWPEWMEDAGQYFSEHEVDFGE